MHYVNAQFTTSRHSYLGCAAILARAPAELMSVGVQVCVTRWAATNITLRSEHPINYSYMLRSNMQYVNAQSITSRCRLVS